MASWNHPQSWSNSEHHTKAPHMLRRVRTPCRHRAHAPANALSSAPTSSFDISSIALNRLSYMWRRPGQLPPVLWSVGIPLLTTYVLEHAPESAIRADR